MAVTPLKSPLHLTYKTTYSTVQLRIQKESPQPNDVQKPTKILQKRMKNISSRTLFSLRTCLNASHLSVHREIRLGGVRLAPRLVLAGRRPPLFEPKDCPDTARRDRTNSMRRMSGGSLATLRQWKEFNVEELGVEGLSGENLLSSMGFFGEGDGYVGRIQSKLLVEQAYNRDRPKEYCACT